MAKDYKNPPRPAIDNTIVDAATEATAIWASRLKEIAHIHEGDLPQRAALITDVVNKENPKAPITHETAYGWLVGHDVPRRQGHYNSVISALGIPRFSQKAANDLEVKIEKQVKTELKKAQEDKKTVSEDKVRAAATKVVYRRHPIEHLQLLEGELRGLWEEAQAELSNVKVRPLSEGKLPKIKDFKPTTNVSKVNMDREEELKKAKEGKGRAA